MEEASTPIIRVVARPTIAALSLAAIIVCAEAQGAGGGSSGGSSGGASGAAPGGGLGDPQPRRAGDFEAMRAVASRRDRPPST